VLTLGALTWLLRNPHRQRSDCSGRLAEDPKSGGMVRVTSPYSYRSATMGSMWAALMAG